MKRAVALAALLFFSLAGCSSAPPVQEAAGPWATETSAARQHASTQFKRDILADGQISDSEFSEAFNRFVSCGQNHGVTIEMTRVKGVYAGYSVTPTNDAAVDSCRQGTIAVIEALYSDMRKAPDHDFDGPMVQCLIKKGLVPPTMTVQEYRRRMENPPADLGQEKDPEAFNECVHGV